MKKMIYGSIVCEVTVAENYNFFTEVPCEYEKDIIAYAVELFFSRNAGSSAGSAPIRVGSTLYPRAYRSGIRQN